MPDDQNLDAYSAAIAVRFKGASPFEGRVYIQGDGNHAVFHWPEQPNTPETTELAEFETQTKWVTTAGKCVRSRFSPPDPNFVGMVSHRGYALSSDRGCNRVYKCGDIECIYKLDDQQREVILSITFPDTTVEFTDVLIAPQAGSRFVPPPHCRHEG